VPVTWASGVDLKTGRPIEKPGIRYGQGEPGKPYRQTPGALGGHNWQAMAFNPKTGLVYIPAQGYGLEYVGLPPEDSKLIPGFWNLGGLPLPVTTMSGSLLAWDPVKQKEAWPLRLGRSQPSAWQI